MVMLLMFGCLAQLKALTVLTVVSTYTFGYIYRNMFSLW